MPPRGYVPDAETTRRIAEAIWLPIYGKKILNERPFTATLIEDSVWLVVGTLSKYKLGRTELIEIRSQDCKVLRVIHEK